MRLPVHEMLETTWSAVAASISVILILLYGYLSRRHSLVSEEGEHNMSKLCTTLFLPCLLFSEIGPLATLENITQYWIIIVYSLLFQLVSFVFGVIGVAILKMPQWIIPCMVFNNATSLPLLLLSSLGNLGTLDPLIAKGDSLSSVLSRGKVYLLINALLCNLTRFSFGPAMMKEHPFHIPHPWSHSESPHAPAPGDDKLPEPSSQAPAVDEEHGNEAMPLLSSSPQPSSAIRRIAGSVQHFLNGFLNPPMIGGLSAVISGAVPFFHKVLFEQDAWLAPFSHSIENLGNLYTVLQMFVLGAHLKSKKGAHPPVLPLVYLFVFRFAIMPVISTSVIYGVRLWLGAHILKDPILDFTMAIAPVGPPALTLAAIVEMSNAGESTTTAVAQTILISYALTPLISFSISGVLPVIQALYS